MEIGFLKEATASKINILIKLKFQDMITFQCENTILSLTSISTNYVNIADQVISYF